MAHAKDVQEELTAWWAESRACRRALWRSPRVVARHLLCGIWHTVSRGVVGMVVWVPVLAFWAGVAMMLLDSAELARTLRDALLVFERAPERVRQVTVQCLMLFGISGLVGVMLWPRASYMDRRVREHMEQWAQRRGRERQACHETP